MKNFKEFINETKALKIKSHKTVDEIAKKHRLDISFIQNQLEMGIPIEHEHTRDKVLSTDIALQHLNEIPDYYTRLKKMEASAKKEHKKFRDVKEEKGEIRYCSLCKKEESQEECKYGPFMWNMYTGANQILSKNQIKYNTTRPHPANESVTIEDANGNNVSENYLRIQTRGTTYTILLNWRGKYITTQMFFQQFTRPTKAEVTREAKKVYPNAIVLSFNPSLKDPTKPLLFTGQTNEPR